MAYAVGNAVYLLFVAGLDPEPFPSVSDPLWLPFYPLAYAAGVLLLRRSVPRWHASMWLDGLVVTSGVAAVVVAAFLRPVLALATGSRSAVLVNIAYPSSTCCC